MNVSITPFDGWTIVPLKNKETFKNQTLQQKRSLRE